MVYGQWAVDGNGSLKNLEMIKIDERLKIQI